MGYPYDNTKMVNFSYSKVNCFRECRFKFSEHYIWGRWGKKTIEQEFGNCIHGSLEYLYSERMKKRDPTVEETLSKFDELWNIAVSDPEVINPLNKDTDEMRMEGHALIEAYCQKYPEEEMETLGVETKFKKDLGNNISYDIRIDRLARDGNRFYIIDYKTYNRQMTQEDADNDEQLAMYGLWVRENYGYDIEIMSQWKQIRHLDDDITVPVTKEKMHRCLTDIRATIAEIRSCKDWSPSPNPHCQWCDCKERCPAYKEDQ